MDACLGGGVGIMGAFVKNGLPFGGCTTVWPPAVIFMADTAT
jgi:hypothetical protein